MKNSETKKSRATVPLRAFPSGHWLNVFEGRISVDFYEKSKEHFKILKTTSGSSLETDLSSNII
jgi:hypothetical protein